MKIIYTRGPYGGRTQIRAESGMIFQTQCDFQTYLLTKSDSNLTQIRLALTLIFNLFSKFYLLNQSRLWQNGGLLSESDSDRRMGRESTVLFWNWIEG